MVICAVLLDMGRMRIASLRDGGIAMIPASLLKYLGRIAQAETGTLLGNGRAIGAIAVARYALLDARLVVGTPLLDGRFVAVVIAVLDHTCLIAVGGLA